MFTGIVEEVGIISQSHMYDSVRTLEITAHKILEDIHIGDSISVNGACLTVVAYTSDTFSVQVIKGTENKTYLADIKQNEEVNLERAMSGNGRFGGHFVLGHVDELGTISRIRQTANSQIVNIKASPQLLNQMVKQGSITVDGVSLTIFDKHSSSFDIHLIPETRRSTILANRKVGDSVHLETDVLFKYVENIVGKNGSSSQLTADKLQSFGF